MDGVRRIEYPRRTSAPGKKSHKILKIGSQIKIYAQNSPEPHYGLEQQNFSFKLRTTCRTVIPLYAKLQSSYCEFIRT